MNVSFPLRDGYFRALHHTPEDRARWTQRVREHVQHSLDEEKPYFESMYEDIDARKWRLVRRKDQLRVYRPRRDRATARAGLLPCLLEIGTIEGSLEDVIYGVHNTTTHDMRTTTSFLSADALDSAVLAVFENGTDDDAAEEQDLYRSFALKWRILETPAGSLVKNRDVLALEYMGISRDADGERFAFHICDSFDHPICPPFHAQCTVRATTHTRIIYRQLRPGRVGVYYCAEYASGGRIPKLLARWTAAEVAVSLGSSVECAEAKKLTAIALAAHDTDERKRVSHRRTRGASALGNTARSCSICDMQHLQPKLHGCDVCGTHVCSKCRTKKYLLSDEGKIQVACCKQCIVAAKNMRVDARQPLAIVSATYWHAYGAIVSANAAPAVSCDHSEMRTTRSVASGFSMDLETTTSTRARAWTLDDGLDENPMSRELKRKRASERQKARDDVYDMLAALSTTSDTTVASMASGEEFDSTKSPLGESKQRHAAAVVPMDKGMVVSPGRAPPPPPPPSTECTAKLWLQMKQLRVAAEQTYRITKKNSENWVR